MSNGKQLLPLVVYLRGMVSRNIKKERLRWLMIGLICWFFTFWSSTESLPVFSLLKLFQSVF
ncbi:hypothetical protein A33Q_0723 [Indibacter alkaliphilus LW1]|uniref:Uncharacterized protein n=1 Tax=Indibacter alkaliphilus (strain CCUG 57479 / KCTC 22604 / LW1) TaxID=1189612 RepID=S2DPM2_INDAL|nr:hypothetical protein A33Q_0723 [Indibacter alkaliphilus LW1]